ncbi:hypothetical protein ONZ45_g14775 [Pleurotus djamor]|nr:hypothetical protein ONZ45_g14775 [Pleurotus djamor]
MSIIQASTSIGIPRQQLFPGRSDSVDARLEPSNVILSTTSSDVGTVCAVPLLSNAAQLALGLLNNVQAMRGNRDAWAGLADNAAGLVVALAKELKSETIEVASLDAHMTSYLEELHGVLKEIDAYSTKRNSQSSLWRVLLSRDDEQKANEWIGKLNHSIDAFGVRAAITNAALLADVGVKQDVLLQGQQDLLSSQGNVIESQQEALQILRRLASRQSNSLVSSSAAPVVQPSLLEFQSLRQGPADGPATAPPPVSASPPEALPWRLTGYESMPQPAASVTIISGNKIETTTHNEVHISNSFNNSIRSHSQNSGGLHNSSAQPRIKSYGVFRGQRSSARYRKFQVSTWMSNTGDEPPPQDDTSAGRSGSFDAVLDVSEALLTTLNDVSAFCAVPFLGDAARLALGFLNTVQTVRGNRDAWIQLAEDAAKLVAVLAEKLEYKTAGLSLDAGMTSNLQKLSEVLQEIDQYTKKKMAQSMPKRIVLFRGDEQKIQDWRKRLDYAIDLFGVRAAISNAALVEEVRAKQDVLLQTQQDVLSRQGSAMEYQQEALQILRRLESFQSLSLVESPVSSPISTVMSPQTDSPALSQNSLPLKQEPVDVNPSPTPVSPTNQQSPPEAPQSPQSPLSGFEGILGSAASITIISGDKIENTNSSVININNSYNSTVKTSGRPFSKRTKAQNVLGTISGSLYVIHLSVTIKGVAVDWGLGA